MYVIVILKTNLLTLIAKEDSYIFSDGKGNGKTWEDRDKISLYVGFHYDLRENKKALLSSQTAGLLSQILKLKQFTFLKSIIIKNRHFFFKLIMKA